MASHPLGHGPLHRSLGGRSRSSKTSTRSVQHAGAGAAEVSQQFLTRITGFVTTVAAPVGVLYVGFDAYKRGRDVEKDVKELKVDMKERFDKTDGRVDALRIDMNEGFDKMERRFDARFDKLESCIGSVVGRQHRTEVVGASLVAVGAYAFATRK